MQNYETKIVIGTGLGNSHVFINGQEIPVKSIKVEVSADHPVPLIELELLGFRNELTSVLDVEAEPETSELVEALIIQGGRMYKK